MVNRSSWKNWSSSSSLQSRWRLDGWCNYKYKAQGSLFWLSWLSCVVMWRLNCRLETHRSSIPWLHSVATYSLTCKSSTCRLQTVLAWWANTILWNCTDVQVLIYTGSTGIYTRVEVYKHKRKGLKGIEPSKGPRNRQAKWSQCSLEEKHREWETLTKKALPWGRFQGAE